jgi:rubrerythrin
MASTKSLMMREPLLERNPDPGPVTQALLVGMATAIEREAVERYAMLARIMERRGEPEVAEAFRRMLDEERAHLAGVERWTAELGEAPPDVAQFRWRLPAELARSWEEAAVSALLTPYRAFALAVDNEQRAFALYSYLAATAEDAEVAAQAEGLALEELRHAALMRRWRREAWHREGPHVRPQLPVIATVAQLHALLAQHEARIGASHRAIAQRLRALGDEQSAQAVEAAARDPSCAPAGESAPPKLPETDKPLRLVMAAQAPLEALGDLLDHLMHRMEGELFAAAEQAAANVIARIARLSLRADRLLRDEGDSVGTAPQAPIR